MQAGEQARRGTARRTPQGINLKVVPWLCAYMKILVSWLPLHKISHPVPNPAPYSHSNVFVGSDSQSSLMALAASSHRDYHHSCTGYTWSHMYEKYLDVANEHTIHFHLQWIPSHVGIEPNEQIDDIVGHYSNDFAHTTMQQEQPIELKAIKSSVKHWLRMKWIADNIRARSGSRYEVCGLTRSKLSRHRSTPKALQMLFSWWWVGKVESCGVYPRRMKWLYDPRCRFCGCPCETTVHLLNSCPDTAIFRLAFHLAHGISFATLMHESPESILHIASFDAFIWCCLQCNYIPTQPTLDSMLNALKWKLERSSDDKDAEQQHKRHKRQHKLVIPHPNLPSCRNKWQWQENSRDIQLAVTKQRRSS